MKQCLFLYNKFLIDRTLTTMAFRNEPGEQLPTKQVALMINFFKIVNRLIPVEKHLYFMVLFRANKRLTGHMLVHKGQGSLHNEKRQKSIKDIQKNGKIFTFF